MQVPPLSTECATTSVACDTKQVPVEAVVPTDAASTNTVSVLTADHSVTTASGSSLPQQSCEISSSVGPTESQYLCAARGSGATLNDDGTMMQSTTTTTTTTTAGCCNLNVAEAPTSSSTVSADEQQGSPVTFGADLSSVTGLERASVSLPSSPPPSRSSDMGNHGVRSACSCSSLSDFPAPPTVRDVEQERSTGKCSDGVQPSIFQDGACCQLSSPCLDDAEQEHTVAAATADNGDDDDISVVQLGRFECAAVENDPSPVCDITNSDVDISHSVSDFLRPRLSESAQTDGQECLALGESDMPLHEATPSSSPLPLYQDSVGPTRIISRFSVCDINDNFTLYNKPEFSDDCTHSSACDDSSAVLSTCHESTAGSVSADEVPSLHDNLISGQGTAVLDCCLETLATGCRPELGVSDDVIDVVIQEPLPPDTPGLTCARDGDAGETSESDESCHDEFPTPGDSGRTSGVVEQCIDSIASVKDIEHPASVANIDSSMISSSGDNTAANKQGIKNFAAGHGRSCFRVVRMYPTASVDPATASVDTEDEEDPEGGILEIVEPDSSLESRRATSQSLGSTCSSSCGPMAMNKNTVPCSSLTDAAQHSDSSATPLASSSSALSTDTITSVGEASPGMSSSLHAASAISSAGQTSTLSSASTPANHDAEQSSPLDSSRVPRKSVLAGIVQSEVKLNHSSSSSSDSSDTLEAAQHHDTAAISFSASALARSDSGSKSDDRCDSTLVCMAQVMTAAKTGSSESGGAQSMSPPASRIHPVVTGVAAGDNKKSPMDVVDATSCLPTAASVNIAGDKPAEVAVLDHYQDVHLPDDCQILSTTTDLSLAQSETNAAGANRSSAVTHARRDSCLPATGGECHQPEMEQSTGLAINRISLSGSRSTISLLSLSSSDAASSQLQTSSCDTSPDTSTAPPFTACASSASISSTAAVLPGQSIHGGPAITLPASAHNFNSVAVSHDTTAGLSHVSSKSSVVSRSRSVSPCTVRTHSRVSAAENAGISASQPVQGHGVDVVSAVQDFQPAFPSRPSVATRGLPSSSCLSSMSQVRRATVHAGPELRTSSPPYLLPQQQPQRMPPQEQRAQADLPHRQSLGGMFSAQLQQQQLQDPYSYSSMVDFKEACCYRTFNDYVSTGTSQSFFPYLNYYSGVVDYMMGKS